METSALNATNVEQAFIALVTNIYQKKKSKLVDNLPTTDLDRYDIRDAIPVSDPTVVIGSDPIILDNQKSTESKPGGCCKSS